MDINGNTFSNPYTKNKKAKSTGKMQERTNPDGSHSLISSTGEEIGMKNANSSGNGGQGTKATGSSWWKEDSSSSGGLSLTGGNTEKSTSGNTSGNGSTGSGGSGNNSGTTSPTITTTYDYEPTKRKSPYADWDDEQLRERLKLLKKQGDPNSFEDTTEREEIASELAERHPENPDDVTEAQEANQALRQHTKLNYRNNYQEIINNAEKREKAESSLVSGEGKRKRALTPTLALMLGEFGNLAFPTVGKDSTYSVNDALFGEEIENLRGVYGEKQLKLLNKETEKARKEAGWTVKEGEDGKWHAVTPEGKIVGNSFDSEKEAEKAVFNPFTLGNKTGEKHFVHYDGKKRYFDSEEDARAEKRAINNATKKERRGAWGEWLTHLLSGAGSLVLNNIAMNAGMAPQAKWTWAQELDNRIKGNNELYYDNEKAKNTNVRKLMELADAGVIDLNNLNNEQMALWTSAVGKENASLMLNNKAKQKYAKEAAEDFSKWPADLYKSFTALKAIEGGEVLDGRVQALLSGQTTPAQLGEIWRTKTKQELQAGGINIAALEEAVEQARIQNKLSRAQADVVKQLVAEQLKAAQLQNKNLDLSNKQVIQQMTTNSIDTLAKVVDTFIPG